MQSDTARRTVLDGFEKEISNFENAVATTAEEVRHFLADQQATIEGHVSHIGAELGKFGSEFLDTIRFAALFDHHPSTDRAAVQTVERALATLDELTTCEPDCYWDRVEPDQSLYETVSHMLGRLGRAFGAARVVQAVKSGNYRLPEHARSLGAFPFARWNKSERGLAPPIVVTVSGADVRANSLSEFLDGRQKIVLVVDGPCPPAPLVRVVSPNVYVTQVYDAGDLAGFVASNHAGIAAIVPVTSVAFTHDPEGGAASWDRITVASMPESKHRRPIGGFSAAQQAEELELLESLATAPSPAATEAAAVGTTEAVDPADKLAAWLLTQADMSNLNSG
jgi:hypothetical protein